MPRPETAIDPIRIFDPRTVRRHRARAVESGLGAEFLFTEGAERLADRLTDTNRRFPCALDLGCRDGALGRRIGGRGGIDWIVHLDAAAQFAGRAPPPRLAAETDTLPFAPHSFDLVLSNLALHWTNDLPGTLLQLRHLLKPDGLLLASLFSGGTLRELRQAWLEAESEIEDGASPRVSPFADASDLAALLQRAGFALPVVDTDGIEVTYADTFRLMHDLRAMGESNATVLRRRSFTRRATALKAAAIYQARFADTDGRVRAHFEITTLTAWAPHDSQPKPLRRGSAAARLADALGTQEHKAGDKTPPQ
jgi:NADH dehydrogenase [ubiquinone] 1 alpha subcomplex assembly factor 5